MSTTSATRPARGVIIKGESVGERDVRPAPWAATVGEWLVAGRWGWACPACGTWRTGTGSRVDLSCDGPDEAQHGRRLGLRPDRWTSAPAALHRELMSAGTVERMCLLGGALALAHRLGAAEALELAAAEVHVPGNVRAWLLDRAEAHRAGALQ